MFNLQFRLFVSAYSITATVNKNIFLAVIFGVIFIFMPPRNEKNARLFNFVFIYALTQAVKFSFFSSDKKLFTILYLCIIIVYNIFSEKKGVHFHFHGNGHSYG